jgi:transglutaminase-like putative cysteine protease
MTATTTSRPAGPSFSDPLPSRPNPSRSQPIDPTGPATLALLALTTAAAIGMGRLFDSGSYFPPLLLAALVGHGTAWGLRRLGVGLPVALPLALAAVALIGVWVVLPQTTAYGFPWSGTWKALTNELNAAYNSFGTVVAPAPVTRGFLLAAMAGVGIAATLADWAAFRVRALFEAAVPSFTLFLFTAILGEDRFRSGSVAIYLAAALAFLVVHQAAMATESTSWFASRNRGGTSALLQGAAAVGIISVAAAIIVGPHMPGIGQEPVIALRDADRPGPSKRTTVSPLVDIRGRLVRDANVEVFTVKSTEPAYWRLTSLDTFDGAIWQSNESYQPTGSGRRLPGAVPSLAPADTIVQEFTVSSLASIWLPAAYRPERLDGIDGISYNAESGSLITRSETTDGYAYRVQSRLPTPTAEQLATAPPVVDPATADRYLALPAISGRVRRLAQDIAGRNTGSNFAKALALQNHFRRGYVYDLKARQGHDGRALERFLFETKTGYCEQFAGAYAVLARAMGLPTRVAVGFTPGVVEADGLYHVKGLHAHAWPEVYLEGYGWVAFEPTPGRGAPGAEAYTEIPAQQASSLDPSSATTTPTSVAAPNTPESPDTPVTEPNDTEVGTGTTATKASRLSNPFVRLAIGALLLLLVWLIAVPLALRVRRLRRWRAATTAEDRVLVAWAETIELLGRAGAPRRQAETPDEYARRVPAAVTLPAATATALVDLARDVDLAAYAGPAIPPEAADRAVATGTTIKAAVRETTALRKIVLWKIDPRPLVPHRVRHRITQGFGRGS